MDYTNIIKRIINRQIAKSLAELEKSNLDNQITKLIIKQAFRYTESDILDMLEKGNEGKNNEGNQKE